MRRRKREARIVHLPGNDIRRRTDPVLGPRKARGVNSTGLVSSDRSRRLRQPHRPTRPPTKRYCRNRSKTRSRWSLDFYGRNKEAGVSRIERQNTDGKRKAAKASVQHDRPIRSAHGRFVCFTRARAAFHPPLPSPTTLITQAAGKGFDLALLVPNRACVDRESLPQSSSLSFYERANEILLSKEIICQ